MTPKKKKGKTEPLKLQALKLFSLTLWQRSGFHNLSPTYYCLPSGAPLKLSTKKYSSYAWQTLSNNTRNFRLSWRSDSKLVLKKYHCRSDNGPTWLHDFPQHLQDNYVQCHKITHERLLLVLMNNFPHPSLILLNKTSLVENLNEIAKHRTTKLSIIRNGSINNVEKLRSVNHWTRRCATLS